MPRGKNYVNHNRGVTMKAHLKEKSMEQCFYGSGCTRENCIYRHDGVAAPRKKSKEPCMPFLAGLCTFSSDGCHKRHPTKVEADKLIAKYQTMKCRYGEHCKTNGCLYIHSEDMKQTKNKDEPDVDFPPLPTSRPAPKPAIPNTSWRPAPVPTPQVLATDPPPSLPAQHPVNGHAASPLPLQNTSINMPWYQGPPPPTTMPHYGMPVDPYVNNYPPVYYQPPYAPHQPPYSVRNDNAALNIDAKEFVPGSHA